MQDIYLYAEDRILGLKLGDEIELWCRDDKLDSKYRHFVFVFGLKRMTI